MKAAHQRGHIAPSLSTGFAGPPLRSSRRGGLLPRASHRTGRAGLASGSLDRSIRAPAQAGL